jgi:DNA-binding transcriptional LysR family regulator
MLIKVMVLRDLDLRLLITLDAVAREGTFGRAAERLGYTQSAVSQQIAALERVIGSPVFDRPGGPRPVELTPLGELVLQHARELLRRVDVLADDLDRFRAGDLGRLDVGTFQSVSVAVLPRILHELRALHPNLVARPYESDDEADLVGKVLGGQLELSFHVGAIPAELDGRLMCQDPFVVVARHDDVDDGPIHPRQLASAPLIGQTDNSCHRAMDAGLRSAGCEPQYVFRSNDNTAVVAMVRAGMGMAVLPLLAVDLNDDSVALRPLQPSIPDRVISLVWRRGRTLSPVATRFIELAERAFADVHERRLVLERHRRRGRATTRSRHPHPSTSPSRRR